MRLEGKRPDGVVVKRFTNCIGIPFERNAEKDSENGFYSLQFNMTMREGLKENSFTATEEYDPSTAAQIVLDNDRSFRVKNDRNFLSNVLIYFDFETKYHVDVFVDIGMKEYDVWVTREGQQPISMASRYKFGTEFLGNHVLSACVVSNSFDFSIEDIVVNKVESKATYEPDRNHKPVTYYVGPNREYKSLQEVTNRLKPGDTVLVDGDCEYPGQVAVTQPGTPDARISIKGVKVNGKRPIINGRGENQTGVELSGHFCDFEGFEIINAKRCGIHHHANSIVIRDTIVHHCPDGILSHDVNSGSITIEYCEIHHCGIGLYEHQLYIATDELRFPGSVFRLQHCYIHHGLGGHNVKTRCERDEIYYNWIENAFYHNLELIGPDPEYNPIDEDLAREDSDVVGNVLISNRWHMVRAGGDGTGQSKGRYRFVNNTFIFTEEDGFSAFRVMWGIESLEIHNNVFYGTEGIKLGILHEDNAQWLSGKRQIFGSNNWIQKGVEVPEGLKNTIIGEDPKFTDVENLNLIPSNDSSLVSGGVSIPAGSGEYEFPNPLVAAEYMPTNRIMRTLDDLVKKRRMDSKVDIGAFDVD